MSDHLYELGEMHGEMVARHKAHDEHLAFTIAVLKGDVTILGKRATIDVSFPDGPPLGLELPELITWLEALQGSYLAVPNPPEGEKERS